MIKFLDGLATWGSPEAWQRFHAVMALVWVVNVPVAIVTDLKASLPYLILVSLMTAFSGEMAALHGVTVEKKMIDQENG